MTSPIAYGIDFGTSNSSIAVAFPDGAEVGSVNGEGDEILPSVVYVDATKNRLAGKDAVASYLSLAGAPSEARLISSLKSFLTHRHFRFTEAAWGERFTLPDLVSIILTQLKQENDRRLDADIRRVVIGHPVWFAGADGPDWEARQLHALGWLEEAAAIAGFTEVEFFPEPTAALMGESERDGIVMAVDFGGGTFDVSIIQFAGESGEVLATHGATIGGELFDSRLFDAKMATPLGINRQCPVNGRLEPIPPPIRKMRTRRDLVRMIGRSDVKRAFDSMHKRGMTELATVEEIIYGGHGYSFFGAIEEAKIELSSRQETVIRFRRPRISLLESVGRQEFESLVRRDLDRVEAQVYKALAEARLEAKDVDLVIRTGGSSRIPGFVERLERMFGADKISERHAYTTVALGLAMRACELWA